MGIVPGAYSGVAKNLFSKLNQKAEVKVFDSALSKPFRHYNRLISYTRTTIALKNLPDYPTQWRQLLDKNKWRWIKCTQKCEQIIEKEKDNFDFVLQVGSKHGVSTKESTIPYVIYTDGTRAITERSDPMCRLWPSEREKNDRMKLEKVLYGNASLIFTFSDFAKNSIVSDYGINDDKIKTVYTGANIDDLPNFDKDYSGKKILFVGKDFHRKGGPTLIKAFKEVKKEVGDAELTIVSKPHLQFPSKKNTLLDFLGISKKSAIDLPGVHIKHDISYEEVIDLYKDTAVFVMPSIQENFGHVFLEAMAYKTPCIGSTVDAMPEIIKEGKTGFLVPPNDYRALANKIIMLLQDETMKRKMGQEGRKRLENYFTWDIVIDKMVKRFNYL